MRKIIEVDLSGDRTAYTEPLEQWDFGQTIKITGLNVTGDVEVHFANIGEDKAYVEMGRHEEGALLAGIPDVLLTNESDKMAYVYQYDDNSGCTIRKARIPIRKRQKPDFSEIPEADRSLFLEEMRGIMRDTKEIAQSVRDDADSGKMNGKQGPKGEPGDAIFVAEYGVTTPDELVDAYRQNKRIVLKVQGDYTELGHLAYVAGMYSLENAEQFPKPTCVMYFVSSTTNEDGYTEESVYRCECNYASNGWVKHSHYTRKLTADIRTAMQAITLTNKKVDNVSENFENYALMSSLLRFRSETLGTDKKYYIKEPGIYLFVGYDYNLNLYNWNNVVGKSNNLIIALFVTEYSEDYLRGFYGKTYQGALNMATPESGVIHLPRKNFAYIENTNTQAATVFHLKQGGSI